MPFNLQGQGAWEWLGHNLRSFLGETGNRPLSRVGKERPKREADHSGLAGGGFNKQGNL